MAQPGFYIVYGPMHLTVGSPARGMGLGHVKLPTDFYGATRPTAGACDAGAAQFISSR